MSAISHHFLAFLNSQQYFYQNTTDRCSRYNWIGCSLHNRLLLPIFSINIRTGNTDNVCIFFHLIIHTPSIKQMFTIKMNVYFTYQIFRCQYHLFYSERNAKSPNKRAVAKMNYVRTMVIIFISLLFNLAFTFELLICFFIRSICYTLFFPSVFSITL